MRPVLFTADGQTVAFGNENGSHRVTAAAAPAPLIIEQASTTVAEPEPLVVAANTPVLVPDALVVVPGRDGEDDEEQKRLRQIWERLLDPEPERDFKMLLDGIRKRPVL